MADKEHLDRVRRGVTSWNEWRKEHPEITPDLRDSNLVRAELGGADLSGVDLRQTNLTRARLDGASLRGADLRGARLMETWLSGADLTGADLSQAELAGAKLIEANLTNANLQHARIRTTNLRESNLRNANLREADLRESSFLAADLSGADLRNCLLLHARLEGANLARAGGLTPEQLESAHTDENTVLPGDSPKKDEQEVLNRIYQLLSRLKKTVSQKDDIEERYVFELQGALKQLEELGHDVSALGIPESSFSQRGDSWEYTAGGEAFETEPSRRVEGLFFREKLDGLLGLFQVGEREQIVFRGTKK
jgi:hypothetical protein